jgi:hypothetical protein
MCATKATLWQAFLHSLRYTVTVTVTVAVKVTVTVQWSIICRRPEQCRTADSTLLVDGREVVHEGT